MCPQGFTVPSESSIAAPRRKAQKGEGEMVEEKETGEVGGSAEATFPEEEEAELQGGRKTPRSWMPERLRPTSEGARELFVDCLLRLRWVWRVTTWS